MMWIPYMKFMYLNCGIETNFQQMVLAVMNPTWVVAGKALKIQPRSGLSRYYLGGS